MSRLFDLSGKCALITGSSRGIGRAIAEAFAAHGANVVICSRRQHSCNVVAQAINRREGGRATALRASIGSKSDLERLVAETRRAFGRIDVLVCNAATNPHYGAMSEIKDEQFEKILRNNVLGTHWLAQLVVPGMAARKDGVIILVSSVGGYRGSPVIGAYNLSKAADLQLARNLAVELGPHNIRVNCLAPGIIRTHFSRTLWQSETNLQRALAGTPLGRIGLPKDIAGAAVFLASKAGRYVTGQSIVIDGGASVTFPGI